MTDDQFLETLLRAQRMADDGRQCSVRGAMEGLDRATRGRCTDHTQRNALYRVLDSMHRGSVRVLDETIEVLSQHLQRESRTALRSNEKMIRFAENYGADSATIQRLKQDEISAMMAMTTAGPFANIAAQACKKLAELLNETTMTSTELQVQLDAALKAEAAAAAAKEADDKLVYHIDLATATKNLLQAIRAKQTGAVTLLAQFRKVLAPLAREFGFKVILVGDAAYVVPR